jgi:hypothetical protein
MISFHLQQKSPKLFYTLLNAGTEDFAESSDDESEWDLDTPLLSSCGNPGDVIQIVTIEPVLQGQPPLDRKLPGIRRSDQVLEVFS